MKLNVHFKTRQKIYVRVSSEFDSTGYMQPKMITWEDGRTFKIEQVRDFRPASSPSSDRKCDCYTVVIGGQEKHLFFERSSPLFPGHFGRWFVEAP